MGLENRRCCNKTTFLCTLSSQREHCSRQFQPGSINSLLFHSKRASSRTSSPCATRRKPYAPLTRHFLNVYSASRPEPCLRRVTTWLCSTRLVNADTSAPRT